MAATADKNATTGAPKKKLEADFKANEPSHKSGIDQKGMPNDTLGPKQVLRAANEALLALRPQPSVTEIESVFAKLSEIDEHGQPKHRYKTAKEAGDAAVGMLP